MSAARNLSPLLRFASAALLEAPPKQIALSGPAGFLGSRVLQSVLDAHEHRRDHGLEPGEVVVVGGVERLRDGAPVTVTMIERQ